MTAMSLNDHLDSFRNRGWTRFEGVYSDELIERIKKDYYHHLPTFEAIQAKKGLTEKFQNSTHHTLLLCRSMLELIEDDTLDPFLQHIFQGKYILNTMGLSVITSKSDTYTQNIHRDVRTITAPTHLWLNTLIMLDDSTEENGATWMLEGSQHEPEKPDETRFYESSVRATGKKGDVLVFDGNIWHAAGRNTTNRDRHIITPIYSRPFLKQQMDYPRAFGQDFKHMLSDRLQQLLGYNARVPDTLEAFYQQDEDRYYRQDQG